MALNSPVVKINELGLFECKEDEDLQTLLLVYFLNPQILLHGIRERFEGQASTFKNKLGAKWLQSFMSLVVKAVF